MEHSFMQWSFRWFWSSPNATANLVWVFSTHSVQIFRDWLGSLCARRNFHRTELFLALVIGPLISKQKKRILLFRLKALADHPCWFFRWFLSPTISLGWAAHSCGWVFQVIAAWQLPGSQAYRPESSLCFPVDALAFPKAGFEYLKRRGLLNDASGLVAFQWRSALATGVSLGGRDFIGISIIGGCGGDLDGLCEQALQTTTRVFALVTIASNCY